MGKFAWMACLLLLSACTRSLSITLPEQFVTVMGYSQGKVVQRCGIRPGTDKFKRLSQLLATHASGWHKRYTSYDPTFLVVDGDISLYFMGGSMVLSDAEGEFSRGIAEQDYQFLGCKAP